MSEQVAAATSSPSFVPGEIDPQWWRSFGDPQLEALVATALLFHPDVKIAEAKIRVANEKALYRRSFLIPNVDFDGDIYRHKLSKNSFLFEPQFAYFTQATLPLNIHYELDIWHKNHDLFYAELNVAQSEAINRCQIELLLAVSVAENYFERAKNLTLLALHERRIEEKVWQLQLQENNQSRGIVALTPLLNLDTEVRALEEEREGLQNAVAENENALTALVGNASASPMVWGEATLSFAPQFPLPSTLPADLVCRRPDLLAQKYRVAAACYRVKVAKANFYPSVDLLASIALISTKLDRLFTIQSLDILGDAATHLPIFDAGRLQAELGVASAELDLAIEEYNRLLLLAIVEVSNWMAAVHHVDNQLVINHLALGDAEGVYGIKKRLFERGLASFSEVLRAHEGVLEKQEMAVELQTWRYEAALGLLKALGGGYGA